MDNQEYQYQIAVATSDGIVVNQHFGRADEFLILGLDQEEQVHRIGKRKVTPVCDGGHHDADKLEAVAKSLEDCKYVLVSRIGPGAAGTLERHGMIPMELPGIIEESLQRLLVYEQLQNLF